MPKLRLFCGLPASGKSHLARRLKAHEPDTVVVSADAFLEEWARLRGVSYQTAFREMSGEANAAALDAGLRAFDKGLDVIWDRTNLTAEARAGVLDLAPIAYEAHAFAFEMPETTLAKRRAAVGREIPQGILDDMRSAYQRPSLDEGFASVTVISPRGMMHFSDPAEAGTACMV